jgi:hypothetical protein
LYGYGADAGLDVPLDIALVTTGRPRSTVGGDVSDQPLVNELGNGLLGLINMRAIFNSRKTLSK